MGVEDNPGHRIDAVCRKREHRAACSSIAAQPGDDKMTGGAENFDNQIINRINVPPTLLSRIGARLDSIEIDAIRPKIAAAEEHDNAGRTRTGVKEGVA